jgi:hypothetical protein
MEFAIKTVVIVSIGNSEVEMKRYYIKRDEKIWDRIEQPGAKFYNIERLEHRTPSAE